MISNIEARFLSSVLAEVPSGEPIADIEFTESELDEWQSSYLDDSGNGLNIKQYFVDTGSQLCDDCGETTSLCRCTNSEQDSVYHLDPEYIVSQWCEEVGDLDDYEDLYVEESGPTLWTVKAVSREFGVIKFFVVSRTDRLFDVKADIFEREFVVSLVEAEEIGEQEYYYMWYSLQNGDHHNELHTAIRETLSPVSEGVCDLDSTIAQDSQNAINNNLRRYLSDNGFERVDPQHHLGQIGRAIDFADIEYTGQNAEDKHILICSCENSANDIHIHYVVSGEIQPVSDCHTAETAAQRMREKLEWRETLEQRTRNITGRTKALALGVATVSLGPIAAALAGIENLDGIGLEDYPYVPELIISGVLLLMFTALILPSVQISLFSWDIRGYRTRLSDRIRFI